jgi:hypothetical protein
MDSKPLKVELQGPAVRPSPNICMYVCMCAGSPILKVHVLVTYGLRATSRILVRRSRSCSASIVLHTRVQALQWNEIAGVIENYSEFEVRAVVRFLQAEGMSQSEILRRFASAYGRKKKSLWCKNVEKAERHWMTILRNMEADKGLAHWWKWCHSRRFYKKRSNSQSSRKALQRHLCNASHPSNMDTTAKNV